MILNITTLYIIFQKCNNKDAIIISTTIKFIWIHLISLCYTVDRLKKFKFNKKIKNLVVLRIYIQWLIINI